MGTMLVLCLGLFSGARTEETPSPTPTPTPTEGQEPAALHEVVVVTASAQPQRLVDAVAPVSVVSRRELLASPTLTLDTQLRQVPGFSLYRRTSSLAAHPTTQGVSLRGIGSSGASRTLVLLDGMPLNDAFGGWVYWNQVPTSILDSVEVVRGATSQLYGSSAMTGAIQLLTRQPTEGFVEASGRGGSRRTFDLEAAGGGRRGEWSYLAAGRVLDTAGYQTLRPQDRGAVDEPVGLAARSGYARVRHGGLHLAGHAYWEHRDGGTRLQENQSHVFALEGGYAAPDGWRTSAYLQDERLRSRFSRVAESRDSEVLTADQDFPSWGLGASLSRRLEGGLLIGADWRRVAWSGHDQSLAGVYAQKLATPSPRLELLLGLRADLWENDAVRTTLSPRVAAVFRPSASVTLRGSAYRGFRAPTLNELYRPFRVGNVETRANASLGEERLLGAEAGADLHPSASLLLRVNGFWNRLDGAIGNVTLETGASEVVRQRQNLGRTVIRGLEAEALVRWGGRFWGRAAYLLSASREEDGGRQLPQSPRHQATLGVSYQGAFRALVQGRWLGNQFEDDLNTLTLGEAVVVDASLGVPIGRRLQLTLSVENLLDRRNVVGRTPLDRLGAPRTILGGVRFR